MQREYESVRVTFVSCLDTRNETTFKGFKFDSKNLLRLSRERSIPDLDGDSVEMNRLLSQQKNAEMAALAVTEAEAEDCPECAPPRLCGEFQTARLFLSHFGFLQKLVSQSMGEYLESSCLVAVRLHLNMGLTPDELLNVDVFLQDTGKPSVIPLDSKKDGFFKDLELLDKLEPRTSDTVHVFYVKAGQSHYQEILSNVVSNLATYYRELRLTT